MPKTLHVVVIALLLAGCGGETTVTVSADETAAINSEKKKSRDSSSDSKWLVSVDGLPEYSGRIITAATMGSSGRYSLGASGFTATIGVEEGTSSGYMMFTYHDDDTRCLNRGDTIVTASGDKAVISGEVMCMPKSGGDERSAKIEGWFELDQ